MIGTTAAPEPGKYVADEDEHGEVTGFDAWLRAMLEKRDMNFRDLSRATGYGRDPDGIHPSSISKYASGTRLPNTASAEAIARGFGIPIDDVLVAAGHKPAPDRTSTARDRAHALVDLLPAQDMEALVGMLDGLRQTRYAERARRKRR